MKTFITKVSFKLLGNWLQLKLNKKNTKRSSQLTEIFQKKAYWLVIILSFLTYELYLPSEWIFLSPGSTTSVGALQVPEEGLKVVWKEKKAKSHCFMQDFNPKGQKIPTLVTSLTTVTLLLNLWQEFFLSFLSDIGCVDGCYSRFTVLLWDCTCKKTWIYKDKN